MFLEIALATVLTVCQKDWDLSKHSEYVNFKPSKTYVITVENCDSTKKKIYVPPPPPPKKEEPKPVCQPTVVENIKKAVTVYFDLNSSKLRRKEIEKLDYLVANEDFEEVKIIGYTCDLGSEKYNMKLSLKRAEAVAKYLESLGVEDIVVEGAGECKHLEKKFDRRLDRKAEVFITHRYEECIFPDRLTTLPKAKEKEDTKDKNIDSINLGLDIQQDKELEEILKQYPELKKLIK